MFAWLYLSGCNVAHALVPALVRIDIGGAARALRLVVGQGLALTAAGTAIGLAGAFALARFLSNMLFGVKPTRWRSRRSRWFWLSWPRRRRYLPAWRATRVDPLTALRYE